MKKLWNLLVAVALLCLLSATRASAQFYALKLNALAFATGTSWGTFIIQIPIAIAVIGDAPSTMLIMTVAACLSGAVCGDHISPISDTTILASACAQC